MDPNSSQIFLDNIKDLIGEGEKIENEDELRYRRATQKIRHKERRLEAELAEKENKIEELKTDRKLKKIVAAVVFIFLFLETVALFTILFFQGFSLKGFWIEDMTLDIFITATIIQISSMAIIITKYLFSPRK